MKWLVVTFPMENTVEIVPDSWYVVGVNEDICYFPPTSVPRQKVLQYIKSRSSPGCSWKTYAAATLGRYDDFKLAQKKAQKAEYTDHLSTSHDEDVGRGFRKKNRNPIYLSDDSEEDDRQYNVVYPPPPAPVATGSTSSNVHENPLGTMHASVSCESADVEIGLLAGPSTSTPNEQKVPSQEFEKQVLRQLSLISARLSQQSETLNILLQLANKEGRMINEGILTEDIMSKLPLATVADLMELEIKLQEPATATALAKQLSLIGGSSIKSITRQILQHLLQYPLGVLYSWEGAKGKKTFKGLHLASVIIKAVRLNPLTAAATDAEIIGACKM